VTTRLRIGAALSLSGRFARFGTQAAHGLECWSELTDAAELIVEDDRGDTATVRRQLDALSPRCDLLLGPYSTVLTRAAAQTAANSDLLIWNHGGSGDDVQRAAPGRLVSVLTPTSDYAAPIVRHFAEAPEPARLVLVEGRGRFARQVVAGAERTAARIGVETVRADPDGLPSDDRPWDLFCAGTFEEDVTLVTAARSASRPPRTTGTVAAGVREFHEAVSDSDGVLGVAQWFPGSGAIVAVGPSEESFLAAYRRRTGTLPDYPAVQAAAAAAVAVHCTDLAGATTTDDLWQATATLRTTTLFGAFAVDDAGVQTAHRMAMVRWQQGELTAVARPAAIKG
jgi:ABC-type branched-subunit amino acid transport system substrate-binding protein